MTSKVYVVELLVVLKRFRTVAVRAENAQEARELAESFDGLADDEGVKLGNDGESEVEIEAIDDPHEPTEEELDQFADEFAELA